MVKSSLAATALFVSFVTSAPSSASAQSLERARFVRDGQSGTTDVVIRGAFQAGGQFARPSTENPIIKGNNVYAPDLVRNGGAWNLYYGGWKQSQDVNDRIYFAVSDDLIPEGAWAGQFPIIDNGSYLHVNDPSVQKIAGNRWYMAYTVARLEGADLRDWIAISTSTDGASWTPNRGTTSAEIRILNREFSDIARPSLLKTSDGWKLWFDARIGNGAIHSYLAETNEEEPRNFSVVHDYPDAGGFPGFFEPDVEIVDGKYQAVINRHFSRLHLMESSNGRDFTEVSVLLRADDPSFGRERVSNPGLVYDADQDLIWGASYGMTDSAALVDHDIGFAYTQFQLQALSCPSTWHGITAAHNLHEVVIRTFGFQDICRLRVIDPSTGEAYQQEVQARAGDRFLLVLEGTSSSGSDASLEDPNPGAGEPFSGGCSIATSGAGRGAWILLFGLALLTLRRRFSLSKSKTMDC